MKKKIPTGIASYETLHKENYYLVDKSLMIKEFIERGSAVTLITRPRRFGKTLNMSMMADFFDNTKDSSKLFQDTNIAKTEYYNEINQYPVIYLSFASAKDSVVNMTRVIKQQILEFRYCAPTVKYTREVSQLETIAKQAVDQIITQKYVQELSGEIIYIGLAHCGKDVEMCWKLKK